jgi:hydroxyethylthiazole kinase-like sugar kinase family protein
VCVDPHFFWTYVQVVIRNLSPFILNISNYIVMEQRADSPLAIGAAAPCRARIFKKAKARPANRLNIGIKQGGISLKI